ncbi:P-loop containing nucleoside triphosphate hydrolase protein, partial [Schizophyllum amplum]
EELDELPSIIKAKVRKWTTGARPHQLECIRSQCLGHDTILQAATGSGKTGIVAGPHLLPYSAGMTTIVVSPLLALHDEQTRTFKTEFGLRATAINSANGGCSKDLMEKICRGEWQIVILSPEMLLSRSFVDSVLRKPAFGARCLSVFIDEAHCVTHWGDSFRKQYSDIGLVRAHLPKRVPIVAVTATLSQLVRNDLISTLGMDRHNLVEVNKGNERDNVSQVVREMQHAMNTFHDADFLIPKYTKKADDIPKALVYYDDVQGGGDFVNHLNSLVPCHLRTYGLVRPYNAGMSKDYRDMLMLLFREGHIRVLVCTDAAGMGCDIPDVDTVLQWKAPRTLSAWIQRAGRAARGAGRFGIAIMLVEKAALNKTTDLSIAMTSGQRAASVRGRGRGRGGRGRGRGQPRGRGTGRGRGGSTAVAGATVAAGDITRAAILDVNPGPVRLVPEGAAGEGLYVYIQTQTCRRLVVAEVFRNEKPVVINRLVCCDICNPELLKRSQLGPIARKKKRARVRKCEVNLDIVQELCKWRMRMKKKYFAGTLYAPHALLPTEICETLAAMGPIDDKRQLATALQDGWSLWDELGDELFEAMNVMDIPSLPPKKR